MKLVKTFAGFALAITLGGCGSTYYLEQSSDFVEQTVKAFEPIVEHDKIVNQTMTEYQQARFIAAKDDSCQLTGRKFIRLAGSFFTKTIKNIGNSQLTQRCAALLNNETPAVCPPGSTDCPTVCYTQHERACITFLESTYGYPAVIKEYNNQGFDNSTPLDVREKARSQIIAQAKYANAKSIANLINNIEMGKYQLYDTEMAAERAVFIGSFLNEIARFAEPKDSSVKERLTKLVEKAENLHKKYYEVADQDYPDSKTSQYKKYTEKAEAVGGLLKFLRDAIQNSQNRAAIKQQIANNYDDVVKHLEILAVRADRNRKLGANIAASTFDIKAEMLERRWFGAKNAEERKTVLDEYIQEQAEFNAHGQKPSFIDISAGIVQALDNLKKLFDGNPTDEQKREIVERSLSEFKTFVSAVRGVIDVF